MKVETITFWRQPGDKTRKRTSSEPSRHVTMEEMGEELKSLIRSGFSFEDQGHKIVLTKVTLEEGEQN